MKTFNLMIASMITSLTFAAPALAEDLNCHLTALYDTSFFGETLSVNQAPTIAIKSDVLVIGSDLYPVNDKEFIQYRDRSFDGRDQDVLLFHDTGKLNYEVRWEGGVGTLTGQRAEESKQLIANFTCD